MRISAINVLGWYGVVAIVVGYGLITLHVFTVDSWLYLLLNLTGSAGILVEAWTKRDYQPVALNLIRIMVALIGIIRLVMI